MQTISGRYRIPAISGPYYQISKSYLCGGTLINSYTVLTAAHCIETEFDHTVNGVTYKIPVNDPYDVSQYSVYVGAYDKTYLDKYPTVKMELKKIIRVRN